MGYSLIFILLTSVLCTVTYGRRRFYGGSSSSDEDNGIFQGSCPRDWRQTEQGGRKTCIKVFYDVERTWLTARQVCMSEGGDLVMIRNENVNDFVKDLLETGNRYWIGIRDADHDRSFHYVDGRDITFYHPWAHREPDNMGGDEYCVEMTADRDGHWSDKNCGLERKFICQRDSDSSYDNAETHDALSTNFEDGKKHFNEGRTNYWTVTDNPHNDHTLPDHKGFYIKMEEGPRRDVYLTSRKVRNKESSCLTFWYQLNGQTASFLKVYWGAFRKFNKRIQDTNGRWVRGFIDLARGTHNRLKFRTHIAKNRLNGKTELYLDDIYLHRGTCSSNGF